jgi:hypothetical protein
VAEYHTCPFYYDDEVISKDSIEEHKHTYHIWYWYNMNNVRVKISQVDFAELYVEKDTLKVEQFIDYILPKIAKWHYEKFINTTERN